ncbi:Antitoxin ParD1 [Caulifigura coniformis]|uniref:Antitoxin ParD1 n=1 Tax=Caulifigura coniformis TaxID=2527983 RepID=A0A517SM63_9PLAN|nr:type II toxin-antitoxin system ParD family antitoxin [Caulifigura coniformis]QDT57213.1 Antitoxin ParD1 [Caulifigura coniformis]
MSKNTSITLGDHFEQFVDRQIASGRFSNASELIRSGLRLLEEQEQKREALIQALLVGERSGDAGEVDFAQIRRAARRQAGIPATDA